MAAVSSKITHPFVITGLTVMVFGGIMLLEAALDLIWIEAVIGSFIVACGWFLRHRGIVDGATSIRWPGFLGAALPVMAVLYIGGYFSLMDRSRPTDPLGGSGVFQSSLRWVPDGWGWGRRRPYPKTTVFNVLYRPADRLYFSMVPRSQDEVERLRELGYYR